MSSLLYALGKWCARHWGRVLVAWLVVLAALGGAAAAFGAGTADNFAIPGTESQQALDRLKQTFPQVSGANAQIVATADDVTDRAVRARIEAVLPELEKLEQVDSVLSPWNELIRDTVAPDRSAAIVQVQLTVGLDRVTAETKQQLRDLAREFSTERVTFHAGGGAFGNEPVGISPTEIVGVVVALIVLALTFGSLLAAGMPLLTALLGVGVGLAGIWALTGALAITPTAPMLALMLGLAVGIDYALFVLARHRDQLAAGVAPLESVGRAVATAGSAVVFAGLTVMIALVGLFVAGIPFLTVMGVCAAFAVGVAVLVALTLLPALLGALGPRLAPRRRAAKRAPSGGRVASAWVTAVTRYPLLTVVLVLAGLGVVSLPALDLRLALPDNGTAAQGSTQRSTYELISERFGEGCNGPLVVTADIVRSTEPVELVERVANRLRALDGVASVPLATPNEGADTMMIQVTPEGSPSSQRTEDLVGAIRALADDIERDLGVRIAVTGQTAVGVDVSDRLARSLLPFGLLVIGLSLVLLTMVFRSVAVPIKATVGFLLSVGAAFGSVVAVYQWGWFGDALHTVAVGPIISFLPIILMGVLFGLAMDYEVFLVSRIREEYVHGAGADQAIRTGFVSSAKVVTAAALIMFAVFAAFVPEGDAVLQSMAFGLAVGVFVDAFVVRMTLVPAVLALLGDKAWWLPKGLDRVLPGFDVEGVGLHRQLELARWPEGNADVGIHAEGLAVRDRGLVLYEGLTFSVLPGEVVLVRGGSAEARAALQLTLAGRMRPTEGRLKVAGYVLPQQALLMRRQVTYLRAADDPDLAAAAARRAGEAPVLLLEGLESLPAAADRARVLDAVHAACRAHGVAAVVTGTAEAFGAAPAPGSLAVRELDLATGQTSWASTDRSAQLVKETSR